MQDDATGPSICCPRCGSTDVRPEKWARRSVIGLFLLSGLPVPLPSRVHHCFECHGKFKLLDGHAVPVEERTSVFVVLVFIIVIALGGWLVCSWTWI